jgi:hypothetical protein
MILSRFTIPNTETPVDVDPERIHKRQDSDDCKGARGNEGGTIRFGAEVDDKGGHGANVD